MTDLVPIFIQEGIIIGIIILIQFIVFWNTLKKIRLYKKLIPDSQDFKMNRANIPIEVLSEKGADEIIREVDNYIPGEDGAFTFEIPVIKITQAAEEVFRKIIFSLNVYLLKNRGTVADFNLVKDIIERNTDAVDTDIRITLPIPLYLGLMGTMLGIVVGLFNMPDLGIEIVNGSQDALSPNPAAENFTRGINILLGGVKVAMIASFTGLLMTTLNSGIFYKGSKGVVEQKKNDFYNFIQRELLPILSQNVTAGLRSFEDKLTKFTNQFTTNLQYLEGIMNKNYDTLKVQQNVLDKLENSNFSELIKSNIKTFTKIQRSVLELERSATALDRFNGYLNNINSFVHKSDQLNSRVIELMDRTSNFQTIAENVDGNLEESRKLQTYLTSHFTELENRGQLINQAVAKVDVVLDKSLSDLEEHVRVKMQEIKDFTIQEQTRLEDTLNENAENLKIFFEVMQDNMSNSLKANQESFAKLDYLEPFSQNFETFVNEQREINKRMEEGFSNLKETSKNMEKRVSVTPVSNGLTTGVSSPFNTWLTVGLKILAVLFFLTYLTFFMIDRFAN